MELLLIILVAFQTIFVVVACVILIRLTRQLKGATDELTQLVRETRPKLTEAVNGIHDFVKTIEPVGEQLVDVSINLREIIGTTREVTDDIADFLQDTTNMARRQVSHMDNLLTDTVRKVEAVTTTITSNLLNPLAEITAFFRGVKTAIGYLRGERRPRQVPQSQFDEDMYI